MTLFRTFYGCFGSFQAIHGTVYRGKGECREVGAVVEVALTREQKAWLDALASARGLTLEEAVLVALDAAREATE